MSNSGLCFATRVLNCALDICRSRTGIHLFRPLLRQLLQEFPKVSNAFLASSNPLGRSLSIATQGRGAVQHSIKSTCQTGMLLLATLAGRAERATSVALVQAHAGVSRQRLARLLLHTWGRSSNSTKVGWWAERMWGNARGRHGLTCLQRCRQAACRRGPWACTDCGHRNRSCVHMAEPWHNWLPLDPMQHLWGLWVCRPLQCCWPWPLDRGSGCLPTPYRDWRARARRKDLHRHGEPPLPCWRHG
mmetsp:Transcript_60580/g.195128  ORF Transcript_60580/g.195128 Transcript_60580/m.195128 type:complete len:246 (+) Transcript_60580:2314-3051(+)